MLEFMNDMFSSHVGTLYETSPLTQIAYQCTFESYDMYAIKRHDGGFLRAQPIDEWYLNPISCGVVRGRYLI